MKRSLANFLLSMTIFGTIGLFVDAIPLASGAIALFRAVLGLGVLLLVMALTRQKLRLDVIKKDLLLLCISGGAMGLNWVLLFEAYRHTTVATATVCYYLAPAFLMLASPLLGEKLTAKKLLCLGACLVGMVLVTGIDGGNFAGVAFGIGAAILYACVMFINRKIRYVSDYERTVTQMAMSIPVVLVYVLLGGGIRLEGMGATQWLLMAVVGIVHTGFAYFLYFGAVGKLPAGTVAVCSYLDPVVAVLLSAILIAPIGTPAICGAVLILGSTLLGQLKMDN